jgi:hypothetical protein
MIYVNSNQLRNFVQLKHRVKLFVNVVDDKQTDSTSENICMNIDMSINDDVCIINTCTKSITINIKMYTWYNLFTRNSMNR